MSCKAYIYFEGYFPKGEHIGGIGVLALTDKGEVLFKISKKVDVGEERGIIGAVADALERLKDANIDEIVFFLPNQRIIRELEGVYKVTNPLVKNQIKSIKSKLESLRAKYKFKRGSFRKMERARSLAIKGYNEGKDGKGFLRMFPYGVPMNERGVLQDVQRSAGGVVYKRERGKYWICLIAKKNRRVWMLPKGRVNPDETPEETAVREVAEETGHKAKVQMLLDEIDYFFYWRENNTFYHKFVYFYLMPIEEENAYQRDKEADAVLWFTPEEAYKKATYINEKEVIRKAKTIFDVSG